MIWKLHPGCRKLTYLSIVDHNLEFTMCVSVVCTFPVDMDILLLDGTVLGHQVVTGPIYLLVKLWESDLVL